MAHGGRLPPSNHWNVDASKMIIYADGKGQTMHTIVSSNDVEQTLESTRNQDSLNVLIKWMQLASGEGDFGKVGSFYYYYYFT